MDRALVEGPALRRPFFWRSHGAFLLLLAVVAPLTVVFSWQAVIASVSDDSVSYLTLARHLASLGGDPLISPWAKYYGHFPPLFPIVLALSGGAHSLLAAHLAVGGCALLALCLVYRYAALRLGSSLAGCLVALLFVLSPSAWISIRGIMSEPLYLALSLAALVFHARRLEGGASARASLFFGVLLAAAYLTRVAAMALIAAYAVHVAVEWIARRQRPPAQAFVALIPLLALVGAWLALRPQPDLDDYRWTLQSMLGGWWSQPRLLASNSWNSLTGGWVSSFTSESGVGFAMRVIVGTVGAAGIAGALLGARRNRLDSWYVLISLAMLFVWVFPEDNARRLLYPLLPVLLVHGAEALAAAARWWTRDGGGARRERLALFAGWLFVTAMTMPASLLILQKAADRTPLIPGFAYSPSAMTEYYTTVNVAQARAIARRQASVLAGLEDLERTTPPDARVMWMRPEYVALLGHRAGVPWFFEWDRATLAREIRGTGAGYLVVARIFKSDLAGRGGDAFAAIALDPPAYLRARGSIMNPDTDVQEFVLAEVDRAALDLYLASVR